MIYKYLSDIHISVQIYKYYLRYTNIPKKKRASYLMLFQLSKLKDDSESLLWLSGKAFVGMFETPALK